MRKFFVLLMAVLLAGCAQTTVEVRSWKTAVQGVELVADVYQPSRINGVGFVILHGSSTFGRKLALYEEIAKALAGTGHVVVNVDQRGYGESDDPRQMESPGDFDFVGDIVELMERLVADEAFARVEDWYILGHSFGAGVALQAGTQSEHVKAIVSISPGRRITERFFDAPDRRGFDYLQKRKSEDMELSPMIPSELLEPMLESYNMDRLRGHAFEKPLLFIEGDQEPAADLEFSRAWFSSLSGPVRHIIVHHANHYFGTGVVEVDGVDQWALTDKEGFNRLMLPMVKWIQEQQLEQKK